jgi:hypothetical protein
MLTNKKIFKENNHQPCINSFKKSVLIFCSKNLELRVGYEDEATQKINTYDDSKLRAFAKLVHVFLMTFWGQEAPSRCSRST